MLTRDTDSKPRSRDVAEVDRIARRYSASARLPFSRRPLFHALAAAPVQQIVAMHGATVDHVRASAALGQSLLTFYGNTHHD